MIKILKKKYTVTLILAVSLFILMFGAELKPFIQNNICTGCEDCVSYCPVNAIEVKNEKAVIDADKCINCKICVTTCANDAIK